MSLKVSTWVWEHSPESGTALLILLAMADHTNKEGISWPSMAFLAWKARCSKRQAQRLVVELEQRCRILVERSRGGPRASHRYTVLTTGDVRHPFTWPSSSNDDNIASLEEASQMTPPKTVTNPENNGDTTMSQEPPLEPSNIIITKGAKNPLAPFETPWWMKPFEDLPAWENISDKQKVNMVKFTTDNYTLPFEFEARKFTDYWLDPPKGRKLKRLVQAWYNWLDKALQRQGDKPIFDARLGRDPSLYTEADQD